jgi:hypothetical protein
MSIATEIRAANLTNDEYRIVRHHMGRAMTGADPRADLLASLGREVRWGLCEDSEPADTARVKLATMWEARWFARA